MITLSSKETSLYRVPTQHRRDGNNCCKSVEITAHCHGAKALIIKDQQKFMKKLLIAFLALGMFNHAFADDHSQTWRGVNMAENFGVQFRFVRWNPEKHSDVERLDARMKEIWAKLDIDLSFLRLRPMYSATMPSRVTHLRLHQPNYGQYIERSVLDGTLGWPPRQGPKVL